MEDLINMLINNIEVIYLFIIPIAYFLTEGIKSSGKLGGISTILTACIIGAVFGILLSLVGTITLGNIIMGFVYGIVLGGVAVTIDNLKEVLKK